MRKSIRVSFSVIYKSFDRVWHDGLFFKLQENGIDGILYNWIKDYLSFRSQRVFVGPSYSESKHISAGVPQGSVLGPLLFLIYVNDIADKLLSITRLFADDSSLAVSSTDINTIENTLNHDLKELTEWSNQWLVNFNPSKTDVMFFTLSHCNQPNLAFNNVQLTFVEHHKHLGLTLSNDGTWHEHIANIISSSSKILGSMKMLKFKLKRKTLNQIYISYMRPLLEYAAIVWDSCTNYEKDSLEKIQYEAARVVTGLTRSVSIFNLLQEIGWVSLNDRRKIQKLAIIYKVKSGVLPDYPSKFISTNCC